MIIPTKLEKGDVVRVVSPAISLAKISPGLRQIANDRFLSMGLVLSFGTHAEAKGDYGSSPIESRVDDLHEAFSDPSVKMIITTLGGFNSNQLLPYLDYSLIKNNPKIFCGYSDITALGNAIYAKTGLVTYSGPHYSSFGEKKFFDYTLDNFTNCLMRTEPFHITPSEEWSNDPWYMDQEDRKPLKNNGCWIVNEGMAEGTIIGGNLCTLNLLQGTEFMPSLDNSILFVEDDSLSDPLIFDRDLESLMQQRDFKGVKGLVIGRFENKSGISKNDIVNIIRNKKALAGIPVIANADFGHTEPKFTFPIGGIARVSADKNLATITIVSH
jgi:muramoyltetrapeptide carboxypeptidase